MYKCYWTFRNNHQWDKTFPDYETLVSFINTCGLLSHPDIVAVVYKDPKGQHHTLKRDGKIFFHRQLKGYRRDQ